MATIMLITLARERTRRECYGPGVSPRARLHQDTALWHHYSAHLCYGWEQWAVRSLPSVTLLFSGRADCWIPAYDSRKMNAFFCRDCCFSACLSFFFSWCRMLTSGSSEAYRLSLSCAPTKGFFLFFVKGWKKPIDFPLRYINIGCIFIGNIKCI